MLNDRVVIVTGSTGALGRVVAKRLMEEGARVAAVYRTRERFEELQRLVGGAPSNLSGFEADVTDSSDVTKLVDEVLKRYGRVDALLNIAGAYEGGRSLAETEVGQWDRLMDVNLKSAFLCSKAVLPRMMEQDYGRIVSVSAKTATQRGRRANSGAYAVSKAGIITLTEALAEEVSRYDINVNCVMPSTIDTPANREMFPKTDHSKWVDPVEIAEVIIFLASEKAKPISGAAVPVYGKA